MGNPCLDNERLQTEQDRSSVVDLLACHYLTDDSPILEVEQAERTHPRFHQVVDNNRVAYMVVGIDVLEALGNFDVEDSHSTITR